MNDAEEDLDFHEVIECGHPPGNPTAPIGDWYSADGNWNPPLDQFVMVSRLGPPPSTSFAKLDRNGWETRKGLLLDDVVYWMEPTTNTWG